MKKVITVLVLVLISSRVLAEVPPIDEKDLKKIAKLTVVGDIIDVQCVPNSFEQTRCATSDTYKATLKVREVKKGDYPGKTITILFRDVHFINHCVGGTEHIHRVGERGLYYLVPRGDDAWMPVNWSAVFVRRASDTPLPDCHKHI
ncbi:MAG: hypothetical protein COV45_05865 [Deltaproteobacteria bacterium CG11_big_fil_rev_8_21_14_0_20_47_16]|nr:MAG: hypothetical protein COV45_05865 [Deltaproteobacteria bacterium CG11_big_fil_rev_8_21_14_0_20_47_16]